AATADDLAARAEIIHLGTRLVDEHLTDFVAGLEAAAEALEPAPYHRALMSATAAAVAAARAVLAGMAVTQDEETPPSRRKEERTMRRLMAVLAGVVLTLTPALVRAQTTGDDAEKTRKEIEDLEARLEKVEKKAAKDRINFSGDYRFEAHSIQATVPDHYDGMMLQKGIVDTFFYYGANGQFPPNGQAVQQFIAQNYASYLMFTTNLTYKQLAQGMAQIPPAMQQQLMMLLLPSTYVPGYDADNSILYTNRLRLNMDAEVTENVKFTGRLSMYKAFGDSTGVQVFNGQSNTFTIDGNTTGVPNSDALRVERAYFDWTHIGGSNLYLSIGRRPSAGGPPMHLRQGELRAGSPMGSLIDFQFDGITIGYHLGENSTARICYGLGYESGFGNGQLLQTSGDKLKDAQFAGLNWDIWDDDSMLAQVTMARAYNLTDGFNGLIVLPNNPVTGQAVGAPVVMRFTPSANLGDMDIAGALIMRHDGPIDWFVNFNYVKSHPDNVTTPFGGLYSDPFQTPKSHSGSMYYVGLRYNLPNGKTMLGAEYNHGSEYWFNFTPAQDDIINPKTNTRGSVIEAYLMHQIRDRFTFRLGYINYDYEYSGSGWHIGAPKKLDSKPVLGFPTYDSASMLTATMTVKF
ncbi:MAG TPA: DUF3373 family protein, partial [Thermoanaerobaculaceae bacterium]|nr:DUF3373 family protein [Thermoanaerobaculaceae bacterium]